MKKLFLFWIWVVIINIAISAPKFRFDGGNSYDWGKIRNTDSLLKTDLLIYNDGDDTLKIFSVRPGCGCTTSPLDKTNIEPGGFATARITLQLPKHPGQHTKQIKFSTNDPENQEIYYYLKAEVVPPIKFFPDTKIMASNMIAGDTTTYKIIMENLTEENIIIKEPTADPNYVISTNLVPELVIKPQEKFELVVKIVPDIVGNFNGTVKFKTTRPDVPKVTIPIYGIVTGFKKQ